MIPKELLLYHGSAYREEKELKPGIMHTGELQEWDLTESNRYLYFTSDIRAAKLLALAGAINKKYLLDRFQYDEAARKLVITVSWRAGDGNIREVMRDIQTMKMYMYVLRAENIPGLLPCHNTFNQMTGEYKTKQVVGIADKLEAPGMYVPVSFIEATMGLNVSLIQKEPTLS